jgi:hypothetical protein
MVAIALINGKILILVLAELQRMISVLGNLMAVN